MRRILLSLVLGAGLLAVAAPAGRADEDHERARAALRRGEIVPLRQVLDSLARRFEGDMVEVELESDDGRWTYEIKLLRPDGKMVKLVYDARTGALLRRRGGRTREHD